MTMHLLLLLCSFLLGKGEIWFQLQLLFVWDRSWVVLKLCVVSACHKPLTATRREVCWALLLGKSCLFFNVFVRPEINFCPLFNSPLSNSYWHKSTRQQLMLVWKTESSQNVLVVWAAWVGASFRDKLDKKEENI